MLYYNIAFKAFCLSLFFALCSLASAVSAQEKGKPLLVTSIKPLAIIAQSAFKDNVTIEYLMPAALSPHDVVIKLSDVRKIADADLVLWIGPEFEVRSAKQFANVPLEKLVTAMDLLEAEHQGSAHNEHHVEDHKEGLEHNEEHVEDYQERSHDDHDDHHGGIDPHIWLSPEIVKQLVHRLSDRLGIKADKVFSQKAKKNIEARLKNAKQGNYIVHHQGFGYFIKEFDLQSGLSIRDMLGKQQGAKTQYNLRLEGEKREVSCVFVEPQHGQKDAVGIAKDLAVPTRTIDILAVAYKDELPSYEAYMFGLAKQFASCFEN
ncbi:zinc ABC transporter substrate-binding protein [Porticoccaceae bacterium]|nr:zinc ABC transporter substrate-binding protein [Porticoccaceae bacterium]MDB3926076.1 zinc ABC transporter substrate-binding protein [Porticoccaceae bacterium]